MTSVRLENTNTVSSSECSPGMVASQVEQISPVDTVRYLLGLGTKHDPTVGLQMLSNGGTAEVYLADKNGAEIIRKRTVAEKDHVPFLTFLKNVKGFDPRNTWYRFSDFPSMSTMSSIPREFIPHIIQSQVDSERSMPLSELADEFQVFSEWNEVRRGWDLFLVTKMPRYENIKDDKLLQAYLDAAIRLDIAHEDGFVHKDMKPDHVLRSSSSETLFKTRVIDLDLGDINIPDKLIINMKGITGTMAFISPEQIKEEKIDGRADQYSLGIMLADYFTRHQNIDENGHSKYVSVLPCLSSQFNSVKILFFHLHGVPIVNSEEGHGSSDFFNSIMNKVPIIEGEDRSVYQTRVQLIMDIVLKMTSVAKEGRFSNCSVPLYLLNQLVEKRYSVDDLSSLRTRWEIYHN